jgi:hypothetical protein
LINQWQPVGVLGAVLVEISVIDTHPPLIRILLADKDRVGKPLMMEDFSDEADREKWSEFLIDGVPLVVSKMVEMLSFGGSFRVDVE